MNYAAVLEMVTEVATEGGNIKSYMTCEWFDGMEDYSYHKKLLLLTGWMPVMAAGSRSGA